MWTLNLRSDLILWNEYLDSPKIFRDFRIGDHIDTSIQYSVPSVVKANWGSFYERGVPYPTLDFELCIDTRDVASIVCRRPNYEFHE